ncbi:hypothetical protein SDRG_03910 [Saprolegnia diclina VS20]|uniref:Uncharacterized protein n=1 Tax=Saprolegnia diclina (strain VS20) TaxID=1156394 RepID=T0QY61_SAPDV|nr:hypothetical protein SDRG_03910 [Saprolegnia diclina VS20]EQC38955.1 hypothetical protein SDRG_03910 [Saprolegnia diclina VS20]|eukprot:XP_008607779.1 hypothetical protein SDRG_03910 [Saprolegnia diclina VS20]
MTSPLQVALGCTGTVVLYASQWVDRAPRWLYAPKAIDVSAYTNLDQPTTIAELDRIVTKHDLALLGVAAPTTHLVSGAGFMGIAYCFDGLPPVLQWVALLLYVALVYVYLDTSRLNMLVEGERTQWKSWQIMMVERLPSKRAMN